MPIELIKIGLELLLQRQRTRKIVRGKTVPLHLAEDDLDLIEPTGVRRQPVNPDFKGQCQRRNPPGLPPQSKALEVSEVAVFTEAYVQTAVFS